MKINSKKFPVFLIAMVLFTGVNLFGAVTFTNTPAISNTFNGNITIQIGGLTNQEPVLVQKYLDVNANGVIDAGDVLWQQFNLTDGTNFVIGGVTNLNVPGDLNSATGAISANLNFQADFTQTIIGKYLYKLSSPSGHFTPVTNSFAVTNFPFAQKFTGTIVTNGVGVASANVILFQPSNGDLLPVGGAVANGSGVYTIAAAPGTYLLVPFGTNFVANTGASPTLTLNSGMTITTNLTLIPATNTISGKVVDSTNSNLGLPGILGTTETHTGLLGLCFTDTNGNFIAHVNASQWKLGGDSAGPAFHGYVQLQNKPTLDTTTGNVANVTISFPKASALFYGSVEDGFGNPLPQVVAVETFDNMNGLYEADGYTDTNGNYTTAAIGGLGSGDPWEVSIDNSSSFTNYIFSQPSFNQNGGTNINLGQAIKVNFTALLATNHITGNVQYNGGNVAGVQVYATATISGNNYQSEMDTDSNGNYSLPVANGTWNVTVYDCNDCGDSDSLSSVLNGQSYQDPSSQNVTNNNNNGTANFTVPVSSGASIFGQVTDTDSDPVSGVHVHASDGLGDTDSGVTDGNGNYSINVGNGNWDVTVDCADLSSQNYSCPSDQNVNVSNNFVQQNFTVQNNNSGGTLQITTASLTNANAGVAYTNQLQGSGGTTPYTWTVANGSQPLPSALTLSTNGAISGVPAAGGTNNFIVRLTDHNSVTLTHPFALVVNPKPVLVAPSWQTNRFQMRLMAAANQNYTLQASTNLSLGNWTTLFITNNATTNSFILIDTNASNFSRFYRVLIGP